MNENIFISIFLDRFLKFSETPFSGGGGIGVTVPPVKDKLGTLYNFFNTFVANKAFISLI